MIKKDLKVIVVGAGIGGLTAAAQFLQRGFSVRNNQYNAFIWLVLAMPYYHPLYFMGLVGQMRAL
jgi:NADH dehydrogenase FAD-containing subunit